MSRPRAVGQRFRDLFGREFHSPPGPGAMELRAKSGRAVPATERDSPVAGRQNRRTGHVKVFSGPQRDRGPAPTTAPGRPARRHRRDGRDGCARNPQSPGRDPGFAALLARDIPADDPRARLVQRILAGTQDLDKVVTELLEYTRPVELHLRPVSCAALVEAAIGYLEQETARRVPIRAEIDPAINVLADPDKMRQVLLNILLNAVQSIAGDGEVRIFAVAEERVVTVAIADTGCGISEAQIETIFSPFFTTKEKGTGLGLAVAAKIVEGHGGAIHAQSEVGKGSTFSVRLPRAE